MDVTIPKALILHGLTSKSSPFCLDTSRSRGEVLPQQSYGRSQIFVTAIRAGLGGVASSQFCRPPKVSPGLLAEAATSRHPRFRPPRSLMCDSASQRGSRPISCLQRGRLRHRAWASRLRRQPSFKAETSCRTSRWTIFRTCRTSRDPTSSGAPFTVFTRR